MRFSDLLKVSFNPTTKAHVLLTWLNTLYILQLDIVIDLVIPRGSNKQVSQIKASTKTPVLGHADCVCHVYIDISAAMDMAEYIVVGPKIDYPAACNQCCQIGRIFLRHYLLIEILPRPQNLMTYW